MQVTSMFAARAVLQIPRLHPEIPLTKRVSLYQDNIVPFLSTLVEAGIIQARNIPTTATTPNEILGHGLGQWFESRIKNLKCLRFHFDIHTPREMTSHFDNNTVIENYGIAIVADGTYPYELESKAKKLEKKCKGLYATAFDSVSRASYRTLPLRTPAEVLAEFGYMHWDDDIQSSTMTTKECREALEQRFGDDVQEIDAYLPNAILPLFGWGICTSKTRIKVFKNKQLMKLAASSKGEVKRIAEQILIVNKAIDEAIKIKVYLPDLDGTDMYSIYRACDLLYVKDSIVYETIDEMMNNEANNNGTELLGLEQIPSTLDEVSAYFKKMDCALNLLTQMDKLLSMIVGEQI